MPFSKSQIRLIGRLLFLLVPYSLLRVGFYFYHLSTYKQFTPDHIFESFFLGLRFDVAAICLLNIPVILLSLVPSKNPKFIFFERLLFVVFNSVGIIAGLDDYELFNFMGKRLSFDLFFIARDILDQLPQLFLYYWYFPLSGILFGVIFYYFDKLFFKAPAERPSTLKAVLGGILLLAISFIGIRGGLQHKSINVQTAFTQGHNELGHLVLNTPYHFLRTLKNQRIEKLNYFNSDVKALNIIVNRRDLSPKKVKVQNKNIVLMIMESFSSEYFESGYMPFLGELAKEGVFFPYHLANGRRSIEALPSLLCGLPSLMDEPISKSVFSGNKFFCMPRALKERGYTNYFFHGGSKGTMGFESYTLATGIDRYFSKNDFQKSEFDDGTWGIFDGPFFEFAADQIAKMPRPFFAGIFSLSSHQPYSIPREMKGKFPKGTLEIHESIGYADYALRGFFEKIRKEPWFHETIFIITADHTSKLETRKFKNLIGQYRVPLVILGEALSETQKVTQHSDIPKTILELLGIDGERMPATSVSLMAQDTGFALNLSDGREYLLIALNEVHGLQKGGAQVNYSYDWESGKLTPKGPGQDPLLKAYLQYFFNGLINNNLSIYR